MKRILVADIPEVGQQFSPSEEERHHLQDVRRVRVGEELELLDGKGGLALAKVISVERHRLQLEVCLHLDTVRESPLFLELALAIPSQLSTLDDMLPSLVQLGVNRLRIVPTAWGGRLKKDDIKYEKRLRAITANALKQCGRTQMPELVFDASWTHCIRAMAQGNDCNLILHPNQHSSNDDAPLARLGLLIGPEGGFTDQEVAEAIELGLVAKALGPRILKMETAAVGAAYWAQSRFGDM